MVNHYVHMQHIWKIQVLIGQIENNYDMSLNWMRYPVKGNNIHTYARNSCTGCWLDLCVLHCKPHNRVSQTFSYNFAAVRNIFHQWSEGKALEQYWVQGKNPYSSIGLVRWYIAGEGTCMFDIGFASYACIVNKWKGPRDDPLLVLPHKNFNKVSFYTRITGQNTT